jgi:hypothetical protein
MCVGDEPSTRRRRVFKRRLLWRQWNVLENETTGVRGGIVGENATVKVLLIDAMSIMVWLMNLEDRGCAAHGRRSR